VTAKLNEILAIEKGEKSRFHSELTRINKEVQRGDAFNGFSKTYQPNDDEGDRLPPEKKLVQNTVPDILSQVRREMSKLMDITARKDWTNCEAKGDIILDGRTLVQAVPATYLLFLEKQLVDLHTLVGNLPVLDPSELWNADPSSGWYVTQGTQTLRGKKVPKPVVLIQPTVEHPGQAQLIQEDITVGTWTTVKQSGAMRAPDKKAMLERIEKVLNAVKQARERANDTETVNIRQIGDALFGYIAP
jgi:hypothetical protein